MAIPVDLSFRARLDALDSDREVRERAGPAAATATDAARDLHDHRVRIAVDRERVRRDALRVIASEERAATAPPALLSLRDWLAQPETDLEWRIHGWQPSHSRVILAARAKAGKTTARDGLVRSLTDGDPWLGQYPVQPVAGAIAVIDTEMSGRQLRRWLRDQRIRHDDRVLLLALRGRATSLDLLDAAVRTQWAALLRAHGVRYLILDCLRPVMDALGLDEQRDAGRFLVGFDALLDEAGIPDALIVHHMGHTGERSRGDSRLRDWPDVEWCIVRQDDDQASPRYISAYGRDVDVPETQLAYDDQTRRLTVAGGSRRDAGHRDALDAILTTLDDAPAAMSGRAIWQALQDSEHPRAAVYAALALGVRTESLTVEDGPRRSRLYRRSALVSQCPAVSRECSGAPEIECPAPYIGRDTRYTQSGQEADRADGTLDADRSGEDADYRA